MPQIFTSAPDDRGHFSGAGQWVTASPLPALQVAPAPAYQVEDQDDYCDYDEYVDEPTPDMKGESQEPQDYKNNEDGPKHLYVLANGRRGSTVFPIRPLTSRFR